MIRLKYLIQPYKKSNIQAGEGQSEGPVPFYTSSEGLKLYYNYAQYPSDSISMGTGGFASINYSSVPFSTSTDCFNFSGNKKAYTKFLYYWIYSRIDYVDDLYFWGTGLKHLQKPYFLNEKLALPTLDKQKQIADFLDDKVGKIDDLIINLKIQVKDLELYLKSYVQNTLIGDNANLIFDKTLSRNTSINKNVIKVRLLLNRIKVGPFGSDLSGGDLIQFDTGYPIFDQRCVLDEDFQNFRYFVSKQKFNTMKSFYSKKGDFLLTTRGTIGKAAVCDASRIGVIHPCLIKINFKSENWTQYFYYLFNYTDVLLNEIRLLSSQTTIEALYSYNLLRLYVPNLNENDLSIKLNFVKSEILKVENLIKEKKNKLENLKDFKKSLIYEYISGKKEVPHEFN